MELLHPACNVHMQFCIVHKNPRSANKHVVVLRKWLYRSTRMIIVSAIILQYQINRERFTKTHGSRAQAGDKLFATSHLSDFIEWIKVIMFFSRAIRTVRYPGGTEKGDKGTRGFPFTSVNYRVERSFTNRLIPLLSLSFVHSSVARSVFFSISKLRINLLRW